MTHCRITGFAGSLIRWNCLVCVCVCLMATFAGCGASDSKQPASQQPAPVSLENLSSTPVNKLAIEAAKASMAGDVDGAIAKYSKLIEMQPDDPDWYRFRAKCHEKKDDLDSAIDDLGKAIQLKPKPYYYSLRAGIYAKRKQFDEQVADLSQAVSKREEAPTESGSGLFDLLDDRATAYERHGDWELAIADYSRIIDFEPEGRSDWNLGVLSLDALRVNALLDRADVYAKVDKADEAIGDLSRSLALLEQPTDTTDVDDTLKRSCMYRAYKKRAKLYRLRGENEKAEADETKANEAFGDDN